MCNFFITLQNLKLTEDIEYSSIRTSWSHITLHTIAQTSAGTLIVLKFF